MNEKKNNIFVRVTEKEKLQIKSKAQKCGLTISEYIRKRALGYSPKALLSSKMYEISEQLGNIYERTNNNDLLKIIDDIESNFMSSDIKD